MFQITQETQEDYWEVEYLFDLSFAPGREALSSYRLRDGVDPIWPLCLVARDAEGVLAGAVRFWPIQIGADQSPAILLGPVAVHPTRQGEGLGGELIHKSLEKAKDLGWTRVVLIGDAPYYARFGFEKAHDLTFPPPTNPDRILSKSLEIGAFDDVFGAILPMRDK